MAGATITGAALIQLIQQCAVLPGAAAPPPAIDLMYRFAMHETQGNPTLTHVNLNKSTDYGLMQINSGNLAFLGETPASIMDPCHNVRAAYRLMVTASYYCCGDPAKGFVLKPPGADVPYVESMLDPKFADRSPVVVTDTPVPHSSCAAASYDTWGQEECRLNPQGDPAP